MNATVAAASQVVLPPPATTLKGAAPRLIHVLAIGGAHQLPHIVPVACELERRHPGSVTIFVPKAADVQAVRDLAARMGLPLPALVEMRLPAPLNALVPGFARKMARLIYWSPLLRDAELILCAERTSTILPRLWKQCPPLVHIPHGAGDRAVGFEKRFELFDHVIVAGEKDRDRLLAAGLVTPQHCTAAGPIKLAAMLRAGLHPAPLFDNGRKTILYNPHFTKKLNSFDAFAAKLIDAVVRDGRYNLVVAPHVRMAARWSASRRREWEALAVPGQVIVDLGSPRCNDMTYTCSADLYLGDVSSQVYEFLIRPRPCLFVNAHEAQWQDCEDYAMWHFGDVVAPDADPVAAIDQAFADHRAYVAWQKERMRYSIGGLDWKPDGTPFIASQDPIRLAADIVSRVAGLSPALA
ncbi:glycosyl transferase [Novosphingobium aerophilum]|uniref:glycosyl transferase n=1 Tax=Novosphingobium TaxID=165696 RepID=UPI002D77A765|nr:glycosyl transferase [Novosphingobium sp. RL4]WRT95063.1 glycosyl transferase [Novosphingobium sp. RL4]